MSASLVSFGRESVIKPYSDILFEAGKLSEDNYLPLNEIPEKPSSAPITRPIMWGELANRCRFLALSFFVTPWVDDEMQATERPGFFTQVPNRTSRMFYPGDAPQPAIYFLYETYEGQLNEYPPFSQSVDMKNRDIFQWLVEGNSFHISQGNLEITLVPDQYCPGVFSRRNLFDYHIPNG